MIIISGYLIDSHGIYLLDVFGAYTLTCVIANLIAD